MESSNKLHVVPVQPTHEEQDLIGTDPYMSVYSGHTYSQRVHLKHTYHQASKTGYERPIIHLARENPVEWCCIII